MKDAHRRLLELYLSNLQVNVSVVGYNPVRSDWREFDYRPDYNKFYLIVEGEGWLKVGNQELYPKPGQLALMPEGILQSYSFISDRFYTKYWCHFTAKIGTLNLFDLIKLPWLIDTGEDETPVRAFQELLEHNKSGRLSSSLQMKSCLLKLISYYLDHSEELKSMRFARSETEEMFQSVLAYIDNHYSEAITVQQLANRIHVHPNYFIRLFKKHLGVTPIQYINRKRIDETKWLLTSSELPLHEIGNKVGIPDVSYLSRLFKSATGFSPTAYKSMLSE